MSLTPSRTAVPFWGHMTWNYSRIHVLCTVQCTTKRAILYFYPSAEGHELQGCPEKTAVEVRYLGARSVTQQNAPKHAASQTTFADQTNISVCVYRGNLVGEGTPTVLSGLP